MIARVPVLYEDASLVVVDKPAGLLTVPSPGAAGRTLPQTLREQGIAALPVHRLDRDVSGVVVLARDEATRARLEEIFRARDVAKTYWALALGRMRPQGVFSWPIADEGAFARISPRGKSAVTKWRVLRAFRLATEVEIDLVTGRYNQIRLHFAHAGNPLVGERKYARGKDDPFKARRPALHASRIAFPHPVGGAAVEVAAPLPRDLEDLLARAAS